MRNQKKFVFQIGYEPADHNAPQLNAFHTAVIDAASFLCGGCTTSFKTGWWKEDGAERKMTFEGGLNTERCFEVEVTAEADKAELAYEQLQQAIASAAFEHSIKTNWVHVSEFDITGRHFSVEAMQSYMLEKAQELTTA